MHHAAVATASRGARVVVVVVAIARATVSTAVAIRARARAVVVLRRGRLPFLAGGRRGDGELDVRGVVRDPAQRRAGRVGERGGRAVLERGGGERDETGARAQ